MKTGLIIGAVTILTTYFALAHVANGILAAAGVN